MNEVSKAILNHKYKNAKMRKQVFICRRSRNKRIQDKSFTKLFYAFLEENPVSIIGQVVLVENKYYLELKRIEENLTRLRGETE